MRWHENEGLIDSPARTAGNYRSYTPNDVSRLTLIRRTRGLGFSLDRVRALLALGLGPKKGSPIGLGRDSSS